MPKRNPGAGTETPGDVGLHPVGVAGNPEATNPHEADPTPNTQEQADRVNVGITSDAFEVVGEAPEKIRRSGMQPRGRQLNESTVAALQFLRQHPGNYCKIGEWAKPGAPSPRLQWAGFMQNEDGSLTGPDTKGEKENTPDSYDVRKKIAYTYRENDHGSYDLLLCLTDEDWTPPKKRGPRKAKTSTSNVNDNFDTNDGESANPNKDGDDVPVDEEMEPTEAQ